MIHAPRPLCFAPPLAAALALTGCAAPAGDATSPLAPEPMQAEAALAPAVDAFDRIYVVGPAQPDPGVEIALNQLVSWLDEATVLPVSRVSPGALEATPSALALAVGRSTWSDAVIPPAQIATLSDEGYVLRRGEASGMTVIAGVGPDTLGTQYAAYAALEAMGFGFFHPIDTWVPAVLNVPNTLDIRAEPTYHWRGMHLHTMHPIELMDSFLVPSAEGVTEAKAYIDWLVANRQDYFQWVLQDSVDMEEWIPHAQEIVSYAHERGIRVGIDTPFRFIQQNGWVLAPIPIGSWEGQIEARLALVLQVPFDVINVELGSSEFFSEEDTETMAQLNFTAEHLDEVYGVEMISKVHCSTGQTAPSYDDINYNFLPGLADPRVGVLPHTVQFYDLYRTAPTYDNEDFSDMREFLLGEIGERTVLYYPETAYWVSFDVDVPLYLPHYVYSRWLDLYQLRDSGMDGQVNFSSGLEWGYWLGDWATAAFAFDAGQDWEDQLSRFTRIFGAAAPAMQQLMEDIINEQGAELLEDSLVAWIIGQDVADDFGYLVGIHAQPERVLFQEIREMDAAALLSFESETVPKLAVLEANYLSFVSRMEALQAQVPDRAQRWYNEQARSLEVTLLRITHSSRLVQGAIAKRKGELRLDPEGELVARRLFEQAQDARRDAEALITTQEGDYRWPATRIARRRENPTSYEFGYLYPVSDAYHWRRDEFKAIEEDICPCMGNITNQLGTLFGEGHPLEEWVSGWPDIPIECLDLCAHPADAIGEPADVRLMGP